MNADRRGRLGGGEERKDWHVPESHVAAYVAGELDQAHAWSLESHVEVCSECAIRVGDAAAATDLRPRLASVRHAVLEQAEAEAVERERVGARTGFGAWRLLSTAPALRLPWIFATVLLVGGAVVLALLGYAGSTRTALLLAPLLPLLGVALCYGRGRDPAYEVTVAAPYSTLRLLLLRTAAVLGTSIPLLLATSMIVPSPVAAAAWLLPALALVLVALAVGSFIPMRWSVSLLAGAWMVGVVLPDFARQSILSGVLRMPDEVLAYQPAAQVLWASLIVVASVLVLVRRDAYEWGER